ncbi:MAG: hypothetical protein A3B74_02930 [Candidatus Kerfeldbacteria bacterium RIFCSPHIGHO2_02_FULL_42_14]|uniref:Uncharacterized protein n=1 Tax=Candidatus Kerfeldbacteria bacterium RIFCSPHIGHO2_02_FULL_42_14 TaxID=1798540 RepID=A0A1G2AV78_9BACT|nr:MAG: hypothetical protein A3B74_02930 [Candidatus Kerfeldbacteria bacterium RIFCSPHIGHO2_02_FULL_42_14]OGY82365.1 MAG: hypothetical protein A3E60_00320 [Candidatus Kerfeldbacteria bacterium RIFCSPHIGHO2_12_FULL_42_13]OGY84597.1 MAG: hypothetical protein A3I91_01240 [Candidatus Kerfeldbacteria bacterium RIFCSPLOWO2_02_FULL_42_19]OGY87096.1 MAG: hypothetical protein A3G01_04315 [Candidatus Kerfeldbacteria bacterium RIFCSPLOWO2_12_FULL_43_9]
MTENTRFYVFSKNFWLIPVPQFSKNGIFGQSGNRQVHIKAIFSRLFCSFSYLINVDGFIL